MTTMSNYCAWCGCLEEEHTLPGKSCAACEKKRGGVPAAPGEPDGCSFRSALMCAVCGARMLWDSYRLGYFHMVSEYDDDHVAEPRSRRPRRSSRVQ